MKKIIITIHPVDAPAERVWSHIRVGENVDKWLPVITACHLDGKGEGAKRICTTEQGDMVETILEVDDERQLFKYSIDEQPLLPIENIVGTMQVFAKNNATELHWTLEFSLADGRLLPLVQEAVEQLYAAGANGLQTLSKS